MRKSAHKNNQIWNASEKTELVWEYNVCGKYQEFCDQN